jgi:NAD(P)-dependent dehydrogenase (short-subunit alcohol dehydrogenase family)
VLLETIENVAAIITGAGSGMGALTAKALAEKGAKVALWDLNEQAIEKTAQEIKGTAVACNVADEQSVLKALNVSEEANGPARILINCAGILKGQRVVGREGPADLEHFLKVIEVNLTGTFNVLRLVANEMAKLDPVTKSGERGVVINTASIAAFEGQIGQAAYSASKGGVVGMTLPIARELGKFGIRVMTVAPGAVETPMMAGVKDEYRDAIEASIPYPSRMAKPEEFSKLALHIIENEYLNGSVIRLDGAARLSAK